MQIKTFSSAARNSRIRPIFKTISWRILATVITGVVIYLHTGQIGQSSKITLTAAIVLTIVYYLHEKVWIWLRRQ